MTPPGTAAQSRASSALPSSVSIENIPLSMRSASRWVLWKYEERDGKKTKVPYSDGSVKAKSNDPSTWKRFDEVVKLLQFLPGFGIGFQLGGGWTGIDIDHCRESPDTPWDRASLEAALMWKSYAEVSPSGTGLHVIVLGNLPAGVDKRRGNREIYDNGRFFTVTGNHLTGAARDTRVIPGEEMQQLYSSFLPPRPESGVTSSNPAESQVGGAASKPSTESGYDLDIIKKASTAKNKNKFMKLWQGDISDYQSKSEADLAFVSIISFWTQDPVQIDRIFRSSSLSCEKWERSDYRERTIAMALKSVKPRKPPASEKRGGKEDAEETPHKTLSFFEKNGMLHLDVIDSNEKHMFVHIEDDKLIFSETGTDEKGIEIRPQVLPIHQDTGVVVHIVGLPEKERLQEAQLLDPNGLYEMITAHIRRFIDAPDIEIELFTYFILYTWFYRKCSTAPYLRFLADTGKGKSRMLKVIGDLCFYPIQAGGASTQSGIMRFKERWNGTLVIDEADLRGGVDDPIVKYLNLGFESEKYYLLTDKNDLAKQEIFDPFSPKVIAMREPFKDNATEGRVLSFAPHETMRKDIPIELSKSYGRDVDNIRAHITRFVLNHWPSIDGEDLISCADLNIEPRLQQMARPLSIIFQVFPDGEQRFRDYLLKRQQDVKKIRSESWEGSIFNQTMSIAMGEDDLSSDSDYSQLYKGNEIQALTAKMIATTFKTSVKSITRALSSIGFEVEFDHIDLQKKTDNGWTTKRKSVRKLVVPTPIAWTEITRRYYYSEEGDAAPPCPEVLRGKRFHSTSTPGCVPYVSVPTVPSVPLSITDYVSGTHGTLGTDVLSTQTPENIPNDGASDSTENSDENFSPNLNLSNVADHPGCNEQSVTDVTHVTDHTHTHPPENVPPEPDVKPPEGAGYDDLIVFWDLPKGMDISEHYKMRSRNYRCFAKGCKYSGNEFLIKAGGFPHPLCDRHYQELKRVKK